MTGSSVNGPWFFEWVSDWASGNLNEPDIGKLRAAFIEFGAKPENLNAAVLPSLKKYSNAGRAPAMRAIWGHRFDLYKRGLPKFISDVEENTGVKLPSLTKNGQPTGNKSSGMIQIFGELTALAFGAVTWSELQPYLSARRDNGVLWQEGKKDQRIKLVTPNAPDEGPKLVSSVPPAFPEYLQAQFGEWSSDMPWQESGTTSDED